MNSILLREPQTRIRLECDFDINIEDDLKRIIAISYYNPVILQREDLNDERKAYFVVCGDSSVLEYFVDKGYDFKLTSIIDDKKVKTLFVKAI